MSDTTVWRDVADAWHLFVLAGLASPTSAVLTELVALLLALSAAAHGHRRPAATLTAVTATAALAAHLIH
ncbi:hypothetical protein [Streptomyces alboflavus]|uniref:hypothetical protein n=1 Tax=Streptomyces alboflavus TaxID=67267 RepID=UPI0004C1BA02|nr:hypothetical protein [Streptomyces alboflavus]